MPIEGALEPVRQWQAPRRLDDVPERSSEANATSPSNPYADEQPTQPGHPPSVGEPGRKAQEPLP